MNRIPQQEVRDLLQQIKDKTSVKDQRLQACQQLCKVITNCNHKSELNNDWNDMVDDVLSITSRNPDGMTLKQAAGRLAAQLAALDISQFSWIVSRLKEDYKNCRSINERAILVTILTDSIQLLGGQRNIYMSEQQVQQALDFALCVLADDDSHVVLVAVIDLCSIIAELYQHVFAPQFELVVDYVIGWMVDEVPATVSARCSAFLVSLRPLWDADHSYGEKLMLKFLEDVSVFVTNSLDGRRRALLNARSIMLTLSTVLELFLGFEQDPVRAAETIVHIVQKSLTACRVHMVTLSGLSSSAVADFFSSFSGVFLVLAKIHAHSERSEKLMSECVATTLHLARKYRTCQSALVRFLHFFGKLFSIPGLPSAVTLPLTESLVTVGTIRLEDESKKLREQVATLKRLLEERTIEATASATRVVELEQQLKEAQHEIQSAHPLTPSSIAALPTSVHRMLKQKEREADRAITTASTPRIPSRFRHQPEGILHKITKILERGLTPPSADPLARTNCIDGILKSMKNQPTLIRESAHALKCLMELNCGELAAQMLSSGMVEYLLDILKGVDNAAAARAEIVDALKAATMDLRVGEKIGAILNASPIWAQFKDQRHDLFLPASRTQAITGGSSGVAIYLTEAMFTSPPMHSQPPPL